MHLSDCFLELFTFVRYVADPSNTVDADYAAVREDVERLFVRLESKVKAAGATPKQFDMARFAVFAWIDETILCSTWSGTRDWLRQPLQREYYGTANAGEEFFVRLDSLLGDTAGKKGDDFLTGFAAETEKETPTKIGNEEVLEVYTLCLALGYTGKFFGEDSKAELDRLRKDCISRIVGKQNGIGLSAFPAAYGSGRPAEGGPRYRRVFDPLAILFFLLPLLVVLGVYLAYNGLLSYSLSQWFG